MNYIKNLNFKLIKILLNKKLNNFNFIKGGNKDYL